MNIELTKKEQKILDGLALSYERLVEYKRKNGYYMVFMRDGKIVKEIPKQGEIQLFPFLETVQKEEIYE